ncbi:hypothetical protein JB92DRAFT_3035052 [Gautieria morchelliformis]|nr:hypothetical protein JB92DRAFT_3035052 [Gautieria morchelliformis]
MSDPAAVRRQLKINWIRQAEYNMYKTEAEDQQRRVDNYIADAADEWDIKNQQKLLVESQKMIPETQKRLGTAVSELRELVISHCQADALHRRGPYEGRGSTGGGRYLRHLRWKTTCRVINDVHPTTGASILMSLLRLSIFVRDPQADNLLKPSQYPSLHLKKRTELLGVTDSPLSL